MEMNQIYQLTNTAVEEATGQTGLVTEDLSNVVDVGDAVFNANAFDHYVRSLVNHIGRMIFVNRPYSGSAPSVLMDSWEYGSVLEKVTAELPLATENESWDLVDGASYDPNIFYKPQVSTKFFNKRTTFEIDRSITERQVKQSFSSPTQLNSFISMLYNEVDKALTIKTDELIMRTINNMTASVINDANAARAVNLLTLYNSNFSPTITAAEAIHNPEFIRFAAYMQALYVERLAKASTLFNIGGKVRFTPRDRLHIVTLSEFAAAADIYLQSDTYHDEYTKLANADRVAYWQGSGTNYAFSNTSAINVTTASGDSVTASGILSVMFDRDALGVTNYERRVTTNYNAKAEFTNYFYKQDAGYFNDFNENFVVFYVA